LSDGEGAGILGSALNSTVAVAGGSVSIFAGTPPSGQRFKNWATGGGGIFVNARGIYTEFKMPANDVTVTANFEPKTIISGTLSDDRDGKTYKTVTIGSQTWTAENINYQIPDSSDCNNDDSGCAEYGRHYVWNAALVACPSGWHLPTREEWGELAVFVGGSGEYGEDGAGARLKADSGWGCPSIIGCMAGIPHYGFDDYGFSALPTFGVLGGVGVSDPFGGLGWWWTATEYDSAQAYIVALQGLTDDVTYGNQLKGSTFLNNTAVRCVQGGNGSSPTPPARTVTVSSVGTGAAGGGNYVYGAKVTIKAGTHPDGATFKEWERSNNTVTIADSTSETTTFVMALSAVTVTAIFIQPVQSGTFTDDRDGQTYRTVRISGSADTWMAENLNYQTPAGSWCYDNKPDSCAKYGRLYNWGAAIGAGGYKPSCPDGWHLPTNTEWKDLGVAAAAGNPATVGVGKRLKAENGWDSDRNGTDDYGFSALPGGLYDYDYTVFRSSGNTGLWWTGTESATDRDYAVSVYMASGAGGIAETSRPESYGFSVRCVLNH
jgi:uncharacterized protein (TIGR02145 family)